MRTGIPLKNGWRDMHRQGMSAGHLLCGVLLAGLIGLPVLAQQIGDRATRLFEVHNAAVVQLRVIDLASGDKSSIGSGFQIDSGGRIVSNYHVVSDYVLAPDRYRLEYIDAGGERGGLSLVDVDVVHDLALLWTAAPLPSSLRLGKSNLAQGERVFSLGNPFDLAMTIVEGTFNGYVASSRFRRILLAATLNPGMSGGPALDADGAVIGINVAHGAEQISFLVPVESLQDLLDRQPGADLSKDLDKHITASLLAEQDQYYRDLV